MNSALPLVTKSACEFAAFINKHPVWNANIHHSHLVHYWFYGHLHHGACMLLARLQLRKVRIAWVYWK